MAKTDRPTGIQPQSRKRQPEGFRSIHMTPEDFAQAIDARVKALWPDLVRDLLEALVQRMQGDGRAAASAAIAEPTDELVLCALADWCEEKQLPELGARVRRMRPHAGDVMLVQPQQPLTEQAMANVRAGLDGWLAAMALRGVDITGLVIPHGLDLHAFRFKGELRPRDFS